jgi:hypothetical protein
MTVFTRIDFPIDPVNAKSAGTKCLSYRSNLVRRGTHEGPVGHISATERQMVKGGMADYRSASRNLRRFHLTKRRRQRTVNITIDWAGTAT